MRADVKKEPDRVNDKESEIGMKTSKFDVQVNSRV
jgi:hypothetical protein